MFQFPRFPSRAYAFSSAIRPLARTGVAPFGFDWLIARLQLPSHVSPLSAPFFGLWPLGIHPTPFSAWHSIFMCQRHIVYQTIRSRVAKYTALSLASAKSKYITICDCQSAVFTSYWQLESEKQRLDAPCLQQEQ
jgi:hypothetical protein